MVTCSLANQNNQNTNQKHQARRRSPARFASHHPKDSKANSERGKSPTRKPTCLVPLPLRGADQWQRQRGHTGLGEGSQVKVRRSPFLGCCRLPPSLVASLPPVVGPLWRPGPVSVLVPPSGYLVAFVTARLPYLNAWVWWCSVVLNSSCLMAAKAFGPVWGLYYPLYHVACVVAVLCTPTQRYSSADDPGPHWTPLSYTVAILGNKCGILRSCPLLPSRRPLFLLLVWLWLCSLVFGAFLLFIQSPCLHLGVRSLELRCLREFFG